MYLCVLFYFVGLKLSFCVGCPRLVLISSRAPLCLPACSLLLVTFHPKEPTQSQYKAIPHTFNYPNPTMCNSTNLNKNDMAAAANSKSLRRNHRRRSPATVTATTSLRVSIVEETAQRAMVAESKISNTFTATLNDIDYQSSEKNSTQKKRGAARRGARRPRPDARGRIGNQGCHAFAFVEQFEVMVRRPDARGRIGNKECHALAFAEMIEEEISML